MFFLCPNIYHSLWYGRSCPRFRVPNACSFDDPQSAFPDTRRDTRQPRTSGGVSCVYDVPSGEGDVARPLEEPSSKDACYDKC